MTINVNEGKAAKIRHINLIGNEKFDEETLRESWESNESNWLSWYRRDDQYSREKLSGDLEKLFAAPQSSYARLDADAVISRNRRG